MNLYFYLFYHFILKSLDYYFFKLFGNQFGICEKKSIYLPQISLSKSPGVKLHLPPHWRKTNYFVRKFSWKKFTRSACLWKKYYFKLWAQVQAQIQIKHKSVIYIVKMYITPSRSLHGYCEINNKFQWRNWRLPFAILLMVMSRLSFITYPRIHAAPS